MKRPSLGIPVLAILAGLLVLPAPLTSQEAIGSEIAEYYDLLALAGLVEDPILDYRTLSDLRWTRLEGDHPWKNFLPRSTRAASKAPTVRLYGPELFTSWNSAYPHGMNDGSLWQGVGLNYSLNAGARLELYGFEATFKPTWSWMENKAYAILPARFTARSPYSNFFDDSDLPQRFGDASFGIFDWGDSEIRFSLGPATIGFGTQAAWMGPARRNPLLLSNNAPPFPKVDAGFRKIATPIGAFEFRVFMGRLDESGYFDSNATNDHRLLTGLSAAWAPSFLKGLTLGAHRLIVSPWQDKDWKSLLVILFPWFTDDIATDRRDQLASVSIRYRPPNSGFEVYYEWGRDDFSTSLDFVIRYPFHTQAYTLGARQAIVFPGGKLWGEVLVETTNVESSRDYEFIGAYSFYSGGSHGATHRGQLLGAGIGMGSVSQYAGFTLYHRLGKLKLYAQHINRMNDYVYYMNWGNIEKKLLNAGRFNAELTVGLDTTWHLAAGTSLGLGLAWCYNDNPLFKDTKIELDTAITNVRVSGMLSIQL